MTTYTNQAVNTIDVGRQTGLLLFLLVAKSRIKAKDIHVIGHSLGGQTAGFAGRCFYRLAQRFVSKQLSLNGSLSGVDYDDNFPG